MEFEFDNLSMTGVIELDAIKQDAQKAQVTGEGLADFMDVDTDIFG